MVHIFELEPLEKSTEEKKPKKGSKSKSKSNGKEDEEEETRADSREYRKEANELLPRDTAADVVESALDDRAAAVVGEVPQAAQGGLDSTPHQSHGPSTTAAQPTQRAGCPCTQGRR